MAVEYKASSITVTEDIKQDLTIYPHPGDRISFNFNIEGLNKEIVKGDLIIHLLNGKTITIVNFGLMSLDNKSPVIEDNKKIYNTFSLFGGEAYYEADVGRYVISRVVSSPDKLAAMEGNEYPTSKEIADGEGVVSKEVGNFLTPEQSLVPEFAPLVQDYISKTFQQAFTKLYDSDIDFTAKNQFLYNELNNDIYPIKLLIINPKVTPEYGTDYRVERNETDHKGYKDLFIDIGGGRLRGDEYAHFMHDPSLISLTNERDDFWFDGPSQNNKIVRYMHIGVPSQSVLFTKLIVTGLPSEVKVIAKPSSNLEIKPLGSGAYEITVRGNSAGGVEIPIEYPIGMGGAEGIIAALGVSYEGIQAKSNNLVKGSTTSYLEFKPVRGPEDISNYNKFNTNTFSTLRDPLVIHFGGGNDVIKGGDGDYTYYGEGGNDKAYGGNAKEVFHMGEGRNEFYVGLGNDTVDVDKPENENSVYLSDALNTISRESGNNPSLGYANIVVDGANGIVFSGSLNSKTFKSTIKDFSDVYFEVGDGGVVTTRDDTAVVNSTLGLRRDIALHMGKGNNTIKADSNGFTIDFKVYNNGGKKIHITTTNDSSPGVIVDWHSDGNNKIIGSKFKDLINGCNDNETLTYYGNGGESIANYSDVTVDLTYDASNGVVNKGASGSIDYIFGVSIFQGGTEANSFYGAVYYTSYDGNSEHQADIKFIGNEKSKLSYEKLSSDENTDDKVENGVIIDLEAQTVTKKQTGGKDTFEGITNIIASNNNDTFILSSESRENKNQSLDGLGGFNTIDYSRSLVQTAFNITNQSSGTVIKGGGVYGVDNINNFRHLIGSQGGSSFSLNDHSFIDDKPDNKSDNKPDPRFKVEGRSQVLSDNRISYANISGRAVELDMKLGEAFTVTMYKGAEVGSDLIGKDELINIGVFSLTNDADNNIYMYSADQLKYVIEAGSNSNSLISFEKANSAINLNFQAINYSNISGVKTLKLSEKNDSVIMGAGFFAEEIDGNGGNSNSIDFSSLNSPIVTQILLEKIEIDKVNIGTRNIKVKNFQHIIATASNDVFDIKFDLKNIGAIKEQNIFLDGSYGYNVIDFKGVTNSASSGKEGLIINLNNAEGFEVVDSNHNKLLRFTNFSQIKGSDNDDLFILPVYAFDFNIDGGGGENTVSYQEYVEGIYISEAIISKFKNIQKIIGSQGNDTVALTEKSNLSVDGFAGFNSASYTGEFSSDVNVDITEKDILINKGANKDHLKKIDFINFYSAVLSRGVTFNIKTDDNVNLTESKNLYFSGNKVVDGANAAKLDYSSLNNGVTLNLDVQGNLNAKGYWLSVLKSNDSKDYIQNISHITLSQNSQVYVFNSIGALNDINRMEIDGRGNSKLSFITYLSNVYLDVSQMLFKFSSRLEINFKGFNYFEGSGGNNLESTFISGNDQEYTFDGLLSNSKLSYEKITNNVDIAVKGTNSKGYNELDITKGNGKDKAYNILHIRGSKGNTNIVIDGEVNNELTFEAEAGSNSTISYEKIITQGILVFSITKDGIRVGRDNGLFNDKIINITNIIGSNGNNKFEVSTSVLESDHKYNIDGQAGINSVNFAEFDSDLVFKIESNSKAIKVDLGQREFGVLKNISIIFGTSTKNNTYIFGNFFNSSQFFAYTGTANGNENLTIFGNASNDSQDVLDLRDTDKNLALDPLTGIIIAANGVDKQYITALTGIHTIKLGNGDNQVEVSSSTSAVGWKIIEGGSGRNNISFSKILSGIVYDLHAGVEGLGFQLINFTGVTGSKGNDVFILKAKDENSPSIRIDGNGGVLNTLDFSDLNVAVMVDIGASRVTRGNIENTVMNIQIFKTGKGGGEFRSIFENNYQFIGNASVLSKNTLSYAGVDQNLVFNFVTKSVIKGSSNYDTFDNITKFVGSSKSNIFIFSTDRLEGDYSEITLDGGTGTNNIVNLSTLSSAIMYDIASQFFTVKYNNKDLKVSLNNIQQVIGTSKADVFIFSDSVNKFNANGGIAEKGVRKTADLSKVTSSATVDFANKTISFGNNVNTFLNLDRFIGSKAGGNIFKGLTTNESYEIDGGSGGNNTVDYSGASTGLQLSIKDGELNINKSSSLFDTFKNIDNISLSNLADELIFNTADDLNAYTLFKKIDGSLGDNLVIFNENVSGNNIVIDLDKHSISIGNIQKSIQLVNFTSWVFSNSSASHTLISNSGNFMFKLVEFGANNKSTLDLTKITENLIIEIEENGINSKVVGITSGNRGNLINVKNLLLGAKTYNINFVKFNPTATNTINIQAASSALMSISITEYAGNNANITISGKDLILDSAKFTNINHLFIEKATQTVNLHIGKLTNGGVNSFIDNSAILNSVINVTVNLGTTTPEEANITLNNNTIVINQGNYTSTTDIYTNSGKIAFNSPVNLFIYTLKLAFKEIDFEGGSAGDATNVGVISFEQLTYSAYGVQYTINLNADNKISMNVREINSDQDSYKINFKNKQTIVGSINSDTFTIDATNMKNDFQLTIKEDGSPVSINTLNLTLPVNNYDIFVTKNGVRYNNNQIIKFSGNRSINNIIFSGATPNTFTKLVGVEIYDNLNYVRFPELNTISQNFATLIYLPKEYITESVNLNLSVVNQNFAKINMYYSGGNFIADNFFINKANNNKDVSAIIVNASDTSKTTYKDDFFSISGEHKFESGHFFSIQYININSYEEFFNKINSTIDMKTYIFGDKGFVLDVKDKGVGALTFTDGNYGIQFSHIKNINLNRTSAIIDKEENKAVISVELSEVINYNLNYMFGILNNMELPKYYRILSNSNYQENFPGSDKYPIWVNGLNGGVNNPLKYDTYNNIFKFNVTIASANVYADLLINNNNESKFSFSSVNNNPDTNTGVNVAGANLFWVGDNSSNIKSYIKVHEIVRANPFALMLNKNEENIIDFSSVTDGYNYLFRTIYDTRVRNDQSLVTITNLPEKAGSIPLDDSMKVLGSFAGAKKLILTSSNNTLYIHGGITEKDFNHIDGGAGLSTISFAANLAASKTIDFTAGDNKGFKIATHSGSENKLVNILYTNVKIIENGYASQYQGLTIKYHSNLKFSEDFEHNFIVRQPNGVSLNNTKPITLIDGSSSSSYQLNLYLNNKYMLFSDDRTVKGNNVTVLSEHFAINNINATTVSFVLGLKIDFSKIKEVPNYVINLHASQMVRLYLPDGDKQENLNYNYTVDTAAKTLTITSKEYNTKMTVKMDTPNLGVYEPQAPKILDNILNRTKRDVSDNNVNNNIHPSYDFLSTEGIDYNQYLAGHPQYQLTEGNNAYKKNTDLNAVSENKVILGSYIWMNQYEYEKSLTSSIGENEDYWKDLEDRINDAFSVNKEDSKANEDDNQQNDDLAIDNKSDAVVDKLHDLEDEYNPNLDNGYDVVNNNNNNHLNDSEDQTIISSKENNNNELNNDVSNELDNSNYVDNNIENHSTNSDSLDLNHILELAKTIIDQDKNNDQSNVLNNLSMDSMPVEAIESTYLQDEANSMSYTIDTGNGAMTSYHSILDQVSDNAFSQEQHKQKMNH